MKKFYLIATTPFFFNFFKGQLKLLGMYFDVTIISKNTNNKLQEIASREASFYKEIIIERPITPLADIKALFQLYKLFREEKPYIVHGNTPKGALLSMIAAKLAGVKHRIYMCHGLRFQGASGLFKQILKSMDRLACLFATKVVCVSAGVRGTLIQKNICSKDKAILIGNGSSNGINIDFFDPSIILKSDITRVANRYNIDRTNFIFTFIGRFVKDKGVYELINAFNNICKKHENITLLIIGAVDEYDSYFNNIKNKVEKNSNIIFTGNQDDIRPFLMLTNVLVLPSYREGFGMVLAEAGAMSIPVIASNIDGCNNVVIENVNGIFCEPKDIKSLEKSMFYLYENIDLYNLIKSKTRDSIVDRFDQRKVWNGYKELYLNLDENNV